MPSVYLFTVNDAGNRERVQVQTQCSKVTIREDPSVSNWPTTDYEIAEAASGGDAARCKAGTSYTFSAPSGYFFRATETVGYVAAISGSTTFHRIEE